MFKKTILAAMIAASVGTFVAPSFADHGFRNGPPPLRYEAVPHARHGFVWVPGHWERMNRRHVWVEGTWVRERRGDYYASRRDRDGDGVPNRFDRRPHDPRFY